MITTYSVGLRYWHLGRSASNSRLLHLTSRLRNRVDDNNSNSRGSKPSTIHEQDHENQKKTSGTYDRSGHKPLTAPSQPFSPPPTNFFPPPRRLPAGSGVDFQPQPSEKHQNSPQVASGHHFGQPNSPPGYRNFPPPGLHLRQPAQNFGRQPAANRTDNRSHPGPNQTPASFQRPTNILQTPNYAANARPFPHPFAPQFAPNYPENSFSHNPRGYPAFPQKPTEIRPDNRFSRPGSLVPHAGTSSNDSLINSASRAKKGLSPADSFEFDIQDITGAGVLDRFSGNVKPPDAQLNPTNQSGPSSIQNRIHYPHAPNYQFNAYNQYQAGWATRKPLDVNSNQPPYEYERFSRPNNQQDRRAGSSQRPPRGNPRPGRGRGVTPGVPSWRKRPATFSQRLPEPSMPPPPKTVLNENGRFGSEPITLGCSGDIANLSSKKIDPQKKLKSDYAEIHNLLTNSSTPIQIPGFSKPLQISSREKIINSDLEIRYKTGEAKREEVVNQAIDLLGQNPSMDVEKKQKTAAVVDFLLMSREERASLMAK